MTLTPLSRRGVLAGQQHAGGSGSDEDEGYNKGNTPRDVRSEALTTHE